MVSNAKRIFNMTKFRWSSWVIAAVLLAGLIPLPQTFGYPIHIAGSVGSSIQQAWPIAIAKSPNDPRFSEQTNLNQVKMPPAWDVTVGDSNQIVAIIDTGVNQDHEELMYRLWTNSDEIPNNGRDDDNNGYIDDHTGYNFMNNTPDITDQNGHGTGVASIIAANTDNGRGMAGINWNSKLMVLKALNSAGGGEYAVVAKALRYAADNGAQVINMSFGTYFDSTELSGAVDYAINKGVVIVAAAGNNAQNQLLYPASYAKVISVGAVDSSGQRASFSNYGNNLDVMAPGLNVLMANYIGNNSYAYGSGTSFAAAHVTGLASLILSRNPALSPTQVENIIKSTTSNYGNVLEYGNGIVNAASALGSTQISDQITAQITASSARAAADGQSILRANVRVLNNDFPLINHQIRAYVNGPIIISGETFDKREVYFGTTDRYGTVTAEITAVVPGKKLLIFSDITAGVSLGELTLTFDPVSGIAQYSAVKIAQSLIGALSPGDTATLWVDLKNTGNMPWAGSGSMVDGQMRLGTASPLDRTSKFYTDTWLSSNRVATLQQALVNPGEIGRFTFMIKAPVSQMTYKEYFSPVVEYVTWLSDIKIYWDITVANGGVDPVMAHYNAGVLYKSANLILAPGQTGALQIELINTGTAKWITPGISAYGVVRLGTVNPYDRASLVSTGAWLSPNRALDTGFAIEPNKRATLSFPIKAPNQPGVYAENFRLVAEYVGWFGPAFGWKITVQ